MAAPCTRFTKVSRRVYTAYARRVCLVAPLMLQSAIRDILPGSASRPDAEKILLCVTFALHASSFTSSTWAAQTPGLLDEFWQARL